MFAMWVICFQCTCHMQCVVAPAVHGVLTTRSVLPVNADAGNADKEAGSASDDEQATCVAACLFCII